MKMHMGQVGRTVVGEERIIQVGHDLTVYDSTMMIFLFFLTKQTCPRPKTKAREAKPFFWGGDFHSDGAILPFSFFLSGGGTDGRRFITQ